MNVLIVDDELKNLKLLSILLSNKNYNLLEASSGEMALDILTQQSVDLILLDIMMPGMSGYDVCEIVKRDEDTKDIPIIMLTSLNDDASQIKGLAVGAVDFITKPFQIEILEARINTQLELKTSRDALKGQNARLSVMVKERTQQLELTQEITIDCLASVAGYRDTETGLHIKRTQIYVKELALYLKNHPKFHSYLNDETIHMIYLSAPLHDLGKVAIPDIILRKPDKLTDDEYAIMKKHTLYGELIVSTSEKNLTGMSFLQYAKEIALTHHEKWDGSGYPNGLKGDEIPICGRLMALADVYDALVSKRVYKLAVTHDEANAFITKGRGTHFDPDVVDAFLILQDKFKQINIELSD